MSVTNSPNMGLPIPSVGNESGPNYSFDVNASLTLVDGHDHSPGRGVQITPAGININTNLSFGTNSATGLGSAVFAVLSQATSTLQAISVAPGAEVPALQDLWYTDSAGNKVQITSGGALAAVATSIPGLIYDNVSGTFIWKQGAGSTTPANFDIAAITLHPAIAGTSAGITLTPPTGIASAYNIAFPFLPGANSFMAIDSAGTITATVPTANGITAANVSTSAGLNPVGAVIMYAGASAPPGFLVCDGSAVSRTTYAALFTAISTTYGAGNGSTTFNLPNTQGVFIRGAGSQTISGNTYSGTQGTTQIDQLRAHNHEIYGANSAGTQTTPGNSVAAGFAAQTTGAGQQYWGVANASGMPYIQNTGAGTETYPVNIVFNYIIKT